jgi:hypothetical protein
MDEGAQSVIHHCNAVSYRDCTYKRELEKETDKISSSKLAVFLILIVRVIGSGFSSGTVDPVTSTFSHLAAHESVVSRR